MATEACGRGTSDLGYFLEVWVFIGEVGVENKSGGPTGSPRGIGARPGVVSAPPTLVGPTGHPSGRFLFQYFLYFPEKLSVDFQRIPRTSVSAQNDTTVVLLKTASVRVSSNQIIPKSYKTIVTWHEYFINYQYVGDVSASPSLIPARPRVGK